MVKATKPGLDILQSCRFLASDLVKDVVFERVNAVWASVFALKITHAQLVVLLPPSLVTKDQDFIFLLLICCP